MAPAMVNLGDFQFLIFVEVEELLFIENFFFFPLLIGWDFYFLLCLYSHFSSNKISSFLLNTMTLPHSCSHKTYLYHKNIR